MATGGGAIWYDSDMKVSLIRGVVVLATLASAAFAGDPPRFQVTTIVPYDSACSEARAVNINEVGDVLYNSCYSVLAWDGLARQPVVLLTVGRTQTCTWYFASGPSTTPGNL